MNSLDPIIEAIRGGRPLHLTVSNLGPEGFDHWREGFRRFRHSSGDRNCINCNTFTSKAGNERLEVDVKSLPAKEERSRFESALQEMYRADKPTIALT